jgi:hypothetical protein
MHSLLIRGELKSENVFKVGQLRVSQQTSVERLLATTILVA